MRISDWSSDVCSSDLALRGERLQPPLVEVARMVERRAQARMREQDRIFRQFEQLVERGVGRMARVDDDTEAVHFGDPLLAERAQPLPAPLAGRAIGELIVLRMQDRKSTRLNSSH